MASRVTNRLRDLRLAHGLTQEQLASELDVTRHTILALEVGRYVPSIELALCLAAFFQAPLESIFWLPADELDKLRRRGERYVLRREPVEEQSHAATE